MSFFRKLLGSSKSQPPSTSATISAVVKQSAAAAAAAKRIVARDLFNSIQSDISDRNRAQRLADYTANSIICEPYAADQFDLIPFDDRLLSISYAGRYVETKDGSEKCSEAAYWYGHTELMLSFNQQTNAIDEDRITRSLASLEAACALQGVARNFATLAQANLTAQRFPEALEAATRAVKLDASSFENWRLLGNAAWVLDEFEVAEEAYNMAHELAPDNTSVLVGREQLQREIRARASHDS